MKSKILPVVLIFICLILMLDTASAGSWDVSFDVTDVAGQGPTGSVAHAGDAIKFFIDSLNGEDIGLTVKISDPNTIFTGPNGKDSDTGVQPPGEAWGYEGTYIVTQDDIDSNGKGTGFITNTVTVSCKEENSKILTVTVPIKSTPQKPVAAFFANPTKGNAPLIVAFTDLSSRSPTSWSWNFGDGSTSTSHNPTHTYSVPGTYTVTLVATNAAGSSTATKSNYITVTNALQSPAAAFSATPTTGNAPLIVAFTDLSSGLPTSWSWNFGDGSTSTSHNPTHTYSVPGTYTVTLVATNAAGSSTATKPNYITVTNALQSPAAAFSATPTTGNAPLIVSFTDLSSGSPTSWFWNFGDGSISTDQSPTHAYSVAGTYTVTLEATNAVGSYTATKSNYITVSNASQPPVAAFSATPTSGDAPLIVAFTDLSSGLPMSWAWDFGDGTYSTDQNPTHTYSEAGTYTVNLTVSNTSGTTSNMAIINVQSGSSSSGSSSSGGSSHGSGSSGGGAGGSPEPQSNVETKELSQTFISSGQSVKFEFPKKATPVVYVRFDSKKTVGKTTSIAELLKNQSTLVSGLPSDEVYKFLNIWVGNSGFATQSNIENAVVCFKVEKSWLQDQKM